MQISSVDTKRHQLASRSHPNDGQYLLIVSFSEQVDQIRGEAGTETLAESAAVSFFSRDEELINFPDGSLERRSVDPRLKLGGEAIVELNRGS